MISYCSGVSSLRHSASVRVTGYCVCIGMILYFISLDPGSASPSGMTASRALDRQRVDSRADRAGDRDRRRHEHELVDLVGGAIVGELLEIEDLSHGHAHDRDRDPVPGLVDALLALVAPDFGASG